MKLTGKILSVMLAAVILMTIVAGYLTVHTAYVDLESRQAEVAQRLADELQDRIVDAWKRDGMRGIARTIEAKTAAADEPLAVRWVWFNRVVESEYRPRAEFQSWQGIRLGEILSVVKDEPGESRALLTYLPIRSVDGELGGLELLQPLAALEQQTRQVVVNSLLVIVVSAVIGFAMAYGAGVRWVAAPLHRLIEKTERIGQGDFSKPLELKSHDELDQLAQALNAMCDRLAEQQHQLAGEMAQRLSTLQQLRHAERLSTLGRMAAGIAHELGTPLNVVAGRAALISSGKLNTEEIQASARTIKSEADRITGIVQRLLDFARRRRPQRTRTDLWSLAERTVVLLKSMADKRSIVLRLQPRSESEQNEVLSADVDEAQIQQVLTNLIVNAVQAAPEKSSVEIAVERGTLDYDAVEPQGARTGERFEKTPAIRVSVSDRGPGVPADLRDRIFEPFFTTKDVGEGTGLGLSIVYGIMEEHGGRIEVKDRDGGGAEFIAWLPISSLPTSSQGDGPQQQANEES